jgi:peptidoglycan/xylan/chitin deacetylase (PgdA/CDA1 family)
MDIITSTLHAIYRRAQKRYPDILYYGDPARRAVALTFDDGPHPRDTSRVLDALRKHQVRATFHLVGKHAGQNRDLVQQIHGLEHQLALHCYRHVPFPLENPVQLRTQLEHTRHVLGDACGVPAESIRDLRPPYGMFNEKTFTRFTTWGYRLVMWSCIPSHWMQPVDWSIHQIMNAIVPGLVIVLHDGHGHGRRVAEIVDAVVPRIKALGYEFLTVEEMQDQRKQPPAAR